ncbi:hypothetical protein [Amycolatopsis sp. cmx-4-83]|uniref:hypothetical protein n=1 Tax=Amycolatopsis sp. cmx-4-83 TaxID=2790940 RepID=UPI00397DE995
MIEWSETDLPVRDSIRDFIAKEIRLDDGSPARDRPVLTFVLDRGMPGFVRGKPFKKRGMINECLRLCVECAKSRRLWGREIGRFQLIQLKPAKMEEASAMKLYSSEAATEVAMEAVQLFGSNEIQVTHIAKALLA